MKYKAALTWLTILVPLQALDILTTLAGGVGVEIEGNPLMAWIWRNGSFWAVVVLKAATVLFLVGWTTYVETAGPSKARRAHNIGMGLGAAVLALVIAWNTYCYLGRR